MAVLYGSQTGTCKALDENLFAALRARHSGKRVALRNMVYLDKERVVVVLHLVSKFFTTWSQGAAPAKFFTE